MNELLERYQELLVRSFDARDEHNYDLEDELLSELDCIWLQMSSDQRDTSKIIARYALRLHDLVKGKISQVERQTCVTLHVGWPEGLTAMRGGSSSYAGVVKYSCTRVDKSRSLGSMQGFTTTGTNLSKMVAA